MINTYWTVVLNTITITFLIFATILSLRADKMRTETIRIKPKTKVMLDNLKVHKSQSYDEIIHSVISKETLERRCEAFKDIDAMVR